MLKRVGILFCFFLALSLGTLAFALPTLTERDPVHLDKIQLLDQQINLLKKRLTQVEQEYTYLQKQQEKGFVSFSDEQTNKLFLYKTGLHRVSSRANVASIQLELSDTRQALAWLEANTQELSNQLNALNIFGLRLIHGDVTQLETLRSELGYQAKVVQLEKQRLSYLEKLEKLENKVLLLYGEQYSKVNAFLKSRKLLQLRQHQVQSELQFQEEQNYWLSQLDLLYAEMSHMDQKASQADYLRLEHAIFNANENTNLVYLKTLLARYKDQFRQLRFSLARTNSITLLTTLNHQTELLTKQAAQVGGLIKQRQALIKKRWALELAEKPEQEPSKSLESAYQRLAEDLSHLEERLNTFAHALDRSIQHELSARQGLPGFSAYAWLDLGKEILMMPMLSYQLVKGFVVTLKTALQNLTPFKWLLLGFFEGLFLGAFYLVQTTLLAFLRRQVAFEPASINTRQVLASLILKNQGLLVFILNAWLLFSMLSLPDAQFSWVIDLSLVGLLFRVILMLARNGLLETLHDVTGHEVVLYRRLRWLLLLGAVITSVTVFLHQLPLIFEMRDLFDRLFLLMLLLASLLLLRFFRVVPDLIFNYLDPRRSTLKRFITVLSVFIPSLLFINSLIGLFGYVNLVGLISWYEGIFVFVLLNYFVVRALLSDLMEYLSNYLIQYVSNGWLWTEALLKPLQKLLMVFLFFGAWALLFLLYGLNQSSPLVERLTQWFSYPLLTALNTVITPFSLLKLAFAASLFYWAARWTRELVYRLLLSKTADLGIRNSMAILSQYAVVLLGVLISLRLLGIDLHALFLVASGLLIAISFGLRDLVNNFACGLMMLFERPLRVGDIVCVNDQEGRVLQIGGRAVTIRTWDHMEVIVPNTELFNKSFINWTVKDDVVRTVINLRFDRQDNPVGVQKIIRAVLDRQSTVLKDPEPEVFLKDMVDNHSEFEVRYFVNVKEVSSRVAVRSEVLFALWQAFDAAGIKVPNLQHEIILKPQSALLPAPQG